MNLTIPLVKTVRDRIHETAGSHALIGATSRAAVDRAVRDGILETSLSLDEVAWSPVASAGVVRLGEGTNPAALLEHITNLDPLDRPFADDQQIRCRHSIGRIILKPRFGCRGAHQHPAGSTDPLAEHDRQRLAGYRCPLWGVQCISARLRRVTAQRRIDLPTGAGREPESGIRCSDTGSSHS